MTREQEKGIGDRLLQCLMRKGYSFVRQYFSALSQIWVADALYELVFVEETRKTE